MNNNEEVTEINENEFIKKIGENISYSIDDGILTIQINLNEEVGESSTKKSMFIASTSGWKPLEHMSLNLMLTKKLNK